MEPVAPCRGLPVAGRRQQVLRSQLHSMSQRRLQAAGRLRRPGADAAIERRAMRVLPRRRACPRCIGRRQAHPQCGHGRPADVRAMSYPAAQPVLPFRNILAAHRALRRFAPCQRGSDRAVDTFAVVLWLSGHTRGRGLAHNRLPDAADTHRDCANVPGNPANPGQTMATLQDLLDLMATLRDPERGCPWDRQQTFATIVPHTIEEAYDVPEAIERGDLQELRDELGDLLFQVVFYAQLAKEADEFDFAAVIAAIVAKLTRRHPHVFGAARVADAAEQSEQWERHKADERAAKRGNGPASVLDGVNRALPALSRAVKLQRRVARVGFDWENLEQVVATLEEEIAELRVEMAAGSAAARMLLEICALLLVCSSIARYAEVDPEAALREANDRFERRFRRIEEWLAAEGRAPADASPADMEALWQRAKAEEQGHGAGRDDEN